MLLFLTEEWAYTFYIRFSHLKIKKCGFSFQIFCFQKSSYTEIFCFQWSDRLKIVEKNQQSDHIILKDEKHHRISQPFIINFEISSGNIALSDFPQIGSPGFYLFIFNAMGIIVLLLSVRMKLVCIPVIRDLQVTMA